MLQKYSSKFFRTKWGFTKPAPGGMSAWHSVDKMSRICRSMTNSMHGPSRVSTSGLWGAELVPIQ
jgi:hypothetical protein